MLNQLLLSIQNVLNIHFKEALNFQEESVIYSNLINIDGTIPPQINNKVILTYLNIEQESANRLGYQAIGNRTDKTPAAPNFNINILCSANYTNYEDSLHYISSIFDYFSTHPIINKEIFPALDDSIEKISIDLIPTNAEERNLIWKSLGVHFLPSLLYKVRIVRTK